MCVLTLLAIVSHLTSSRFDCADIDIPIFFFLYAFWKITKKTKVWKPKEMDFVTVSNFQFVWFLCWYRNVLTVLTTVSAHARGFLL